MPQAVPIPVDDQVDRVGVRATVAVELPVEAIAGMKVQLAQALMAAAGAPGAVTTEQQLEWAAWLVLTLEAELAARAERDLAPMH